MPNQLPPCAGVELAYLFALKPTKGDGMVSDVCTLIKEMTNSSHNSLAQFLFDNPDTKHHVSLKADYFVSYTWNYSWQSTVNALRNKFGDGKQIFVWMDLVMVNQHQAANSTLDFSTLSSVFGENLQAINRAIFVMLPAFDPIISTRAWCVFEQYTTVHLNIAYEFCVEPSDEETFLLECQQQGKIAEEFLTVFSKIDVSKAVAREIADLQAIQAQIQLVGTTRVNNVIMQSVKQLLLELCNKAESQSKSQLETSNVLASKAGLYSAFGEVDLAVDMYQQALERKIGVLGPTHEEVGVLMGNLGSSLYTQGNAKSALEKYKQAIEIKKCYGDKKEDPVLLGNIALVYQELGMFDKSLEIYQQALQREMETLGAHDAGTLSNMALVFRSLGQLDLALQYFEQALDRERSTMGENTANFATTLTNMASVLQNQGKYDLAMQVNRQALEIKRRMLGENHFEFASSLENIGMGYFHQENLEQAVEMYTQALRIKREVLGENHLEYGITLSNMGMVYFGQKRYAEALDLYNQSLAIKREHLGKNHPEYSATLNNVAMIYQNQGDFSLALQTYEESLEIKRQTLGENNYPFAVTLDNIASVLRSQNKLDLAMEKYIRALEIKRDALGEKHVEVGITYTNIANMQFDAGELSLALENYAKALDIFSETLGQEHSNFKNVSQYRASCEQTLANKREEESRRTSKRANGKQQCVFM